MRKYKYKNICTCSEVEFLIRYEADERFEEFFCPFCGIRIEDEQELTSDDIDNPHYD